MQNSVNTTPSQVTHTPKNNNAAGSRNTLCNDTCTPRALCVTPSSPRAKPNTPSMIGKPSVAGCNETCTPGDLNVTPSGQRKETATPCNRVVRYPIPSTPCNITSQQRNPNIAGIYGMAIHSTPVTITSLPGIPTGECCLFERVYRSLVRLVNNCLHLWSFSIPQDERGLKGVQLKL